MGSTSLGMRGADDEVCTGSFESGPASLFGDGNSRPGSAGGGKIFSGLDGNGAGMGAGSGGKIFSGLGGNGGGRGAGTGGGEIFPGLGGDGGDMGAATGGSAFWSDRADGPIISSFKEARITDCLIESEFSVRGRERSFTALSEDSRRTLDGIADKGTLIRLTCGSPVFILRTMDHPPTMKAGAKRANITAQRAKEKVRAGDRLLLTDLWTSMLIPSVSLGRE